MTTDIILKQDDIDLLGQVKLKNGEDKPIIHLSAEGHSFSRDTKIYCDGEEGKLILEGGIHSRYVDAVESISSTSLDTEELNARDGILSNLQLGVGAPDAETPYAGNLELKNEQDKATIQVDGQTGSIQFARFGLANSDSNHPMMYVFEGSQEEDESGGSGSAGGFGRFGSGGGFGGRFGGGSGDDSLADRLNNRGVFDIPPIEFEVEATILSLSPDNPNSGLAYKKGNMVFQHEGEPVLAVNLSDRRVGIGTDTPDENFMLDVAGEIRATRVNSDSDIRCKTDLQSITDASAKINQLQGVGFRWKTDICGEKATAPGRHLGLIAQETQKVLPEVVSQDAAGYYSVAYSEIIPVLVEAHKEQQQQIVDLRAKNQAMKRALDQASEQIDRLQTVEQRLAHLEHQFSHQLV